MSLLLEALPRSMLIPNASAMLDPVGLCWRATLPPLEAPSLLVPTRGNVVTSAETAGMLPQRRKPPADVARGAVGSSGWTKSVELGSLTQEGAGIFSGCARGVVLSIVSS